MNVNDIAEAIASTAIYTDNAEGFLRTLGVPEDAIERMNPEQYKPVIALIYVAIGAANEAGEALGAVKKMLRGDHDYATARSLFSKENRDTAWYVFEGMRVAGAGAEDELQMLIDKLAERAATGTIKGYGETNEDRMERGLLIFLQQMQLRGGFLRGNEVNIPPQLVRMLIESGYVHTTLSGIALGLKGEAAINEGIRQGIIDELRKA